MARSAMTDDRQIMAAEPATTSASPLLEMGHISKHFAGVRALIDAHLSVIAGEVHAVMGENGAGKSMQARCRGILASLGAAFSPADIVSNLSLAERQLVEIARAIHANVRILVMDEPTAALSAHESERLFDLITRLRESGLAIIYVSHRIAEIARLADRVTVLRDGSDVGTISRHELTPER